MEELIIQKKDNLYTVLVLEDNKIVEHYVYDSQNMPKIGNIYRAKVKDLIKHSGSAFVDYGAKKAGYIDKFPEKYKINDDIIVMLKKEEVGEKGAKMTTDISLSGKFIVILPNSQIRTFSEKIGAGFDKSKISQELLKIISEDFGYIIRTEGAFCDVEDIKNEADVLIKKWSEILKNQEQLLYDANDICDIIVNKFCKSNLSKIYVNDTQLVLGLEKRVNAEIVFENNQDFIEKFGLVSEYSRINDKKIWLRSSGYIVIEKTEALTAIDVNSGKYLGNSGYDKEDFVYKTNKEAALEVMRQIRLKNIGGIIMIDFINMAEEEHKNEILSLLIEEAKKDRSKVNVYGFTKLGLVEISRKRF